MICLQNEKLSSHTTVRLGGEAAEYLIPESLEELTALVRERDPRYFIGGGSNLLIADRVFDLVVDLGQFDTRLEHLGDGRFRAGASLRLQKLINGINAAGFGGIEYLYSVPGLVGGAIVMNAGRGKQYHQTISDYVVSVDVLRGGQIVTIPVDACGFGHRQSVFQGSGDLIVSCLFKFPPMSEKESEAGKKERLDLCRRVQDTSAPNFGTVFCESNPRIMEWARKRRIGKKVHFSGKTKNWIINEGGTFRDAVSAIRKVERIHRLLFKKCRREVVLWQ